MGVFRQGFDNYEKEIQDAKAANKVDFLPRFSVTVGTSKMVTILDDTGFRFEQHSFVIQKGKKLEGSLEFTCLHDHTNPNSKCFMDNIPRSKAIGHNLTTVTVMTCIDHTGYRKQDGTWAGKEERKLMICKPNAALIIDVTRKSIAKQKAAEMWNNQKEVCTQKGYKTLEEVENAILKKGNVLKNYQFNISRTDDKSASIGNVFVPIRWVKQDEIKSDQVPFNYEEMFALESEDNIKKKLTEFYQQHATPMPFTFDGSFVPTNTPNSGNANSAGTGQDNQSNQGSVASSFNADDIPF